MAIERQETPLRLAEVPALIRELTGERVNFKSVYRWTTKGKRGVRLETEPGIRKRTTRERVLRFLARLSGRDDAAAPAELSRARRRELSAKNAALEKAGR